MLTLFAGTADPALGLRTALAIALHNIPEGLAVAVPFAYATNSRVKGVLAALVSGLAEPAGALVALFLLRSLFTPGFLTGTMVLVAGIMIWVALAQLLPRPSPRPPPARHFRCRPPAACSCSWALRLCRKCAILYSVSMFEKIRCILAAGSEK